MDNFEWVDLVDRVTNLTHDEGNSGLGERLWFFELMVKLPTGSYFQNNIDIGCIIEAAVHFDDVGMVEEHLYFYLSYELVSNFFLVQQPFLYDF